MDVIAHAGRGGRRRRIGEANQGDDASARIDAAAFGIDATDSSWRWRSGEGRVDTAAGRAARGGQRDRVDDAAHGGDPQGAAGTTTGCAGGAAAAANSAGEKRGRVHAALQLHDRESGEQRASARVTGSAGATGSAVRAASATARAFASGNAAGQR